MNDKNEKDSTEKESSAHSELFKAAIKMPIPQPKEDVIDGKDTWWNENDAYHRNTLHDNDPKKKFLYKGGYVEEDRNYLIPEEFLQEFQKRRDKFEDHGALSNYWFQFKTGGGSGNMSSGVSNVQSGAFNTVRKYVPFADSQVVNQMSVDASMTRERLPSDERLCWWKLHRLHLCLMGTTKEVNPLWLFPIKEMGSPRSLFQKIFTDVYSNYTNPECAAERLTADVFCDTCEYNNYVKREVRVYRNWWLDKKWSATVTQLNSIVDNIKNMTGFVLPYLTMPKVENEPPKPKTLPPYIAQVKEKEEERLRMINERTVPK